jgi:CubicO group peptidase (beta-lactamase class C family)
MTIIRFTSVLFCIVLLVSTISAQNRWPAESWKKSTPAAAGLNENVLARLDSEIVAGKYGYVDGMFVSRYGEVVFERSYRHNYDQIYGKEAAIRGPLNAHDPGGHYNYFNPWWHPFYRRGDLHSLQSVTKTVTSVIIGVATTRGEFPSLDTPLLSFFDTTKVANIDDRKRRITLRHVLSMTSGIDWPEYLSYNDPRNPAMAMEAGMDWVQYAINRPMAQEPGKVFNYNSGGSQLLSHIFRMATGKDIEEYGATHLFAPLGIRHYFWKRTPTGLADTEGGLYLRIDDLARIFYLFLCDGVWDGNRIVSEQWIRASVHPMIPILGTPFQYGLKWWLYPYSKDGTRYAWMGRGFGGQMPIILPEHKIVAVFTGWNIAEDKPDLPVNIAVGRILDAIITR